MPPAGDVEEVRINGRSATFDWKIPEFSQLERGGYYSPTVVCFDRKWGLRITKRRNGIDEVFLHRDLSTPVTPISVHFSIRYKTSAGEEIGAFREQPLPENDDSWYQHISPPWRTPSWGGITLTISLRKGDSPHATGVSRAKQTEGTGLPGVSRDTQTEGASCSKCRIDEQMNTDSKGVSRETQTEYDDSQFDGHPLEGVSRETQTEEAGCQNDDHPFEDISILREHWRKFLLSGDGHDVLIKVGDKQFRAHKTILKSRSPVFAAMFGSDMAEGAGDSITIEDCDPDSFGQFLQFVYCGRADIASVGGALSLYYAGDKYDLPTLKKMCVRFLKSSFSTNTVFEVVRLAARHEEEELLQRAIAYFAENLEEVWRTVEWQRFLSANYIQANEMNLKALQCKSSLHKK